MDVQCSFRVCQTQSSMEKQSSRVNYSVDLTQTFNYAVYSKRGFLFLRESTVTSFSFCVFIAAVFFLLWNKTRSHLFGSSPNQTSAGMRPQLWLCWELTIGSLFNSFLMSWGKKLFQIFMTGGPNFLFCSNTSQKPQQVTSTSFAKFTCH